MDPKIIENDRNYQQIEEKLEKEWFRKHPRENYSSKSWIDYRYGSLYDKTEASLRKEAREAFKNNPENKKYIEGYEGEARRIYDSFRDDPRWQRNESDIRMETNARLEWFEKNRDEKMSEDDVKESRNELIKRVRMKSLATFTRENPEKTKAYREQIEEGEEKENEEDDKEKALRRALEEEAKKDFIKDLRARMQKRTPGKPSLPRQGVGNIGQQAQRGISSVERAGSRIVGQTGRFASQAGKTAGKFVIQITKIVTKNPYVLAGIGILIAILIIVFLIVFLMGRNKFCPPGELKLKKIFQTEDASLNGTPTIIKKSGDKIYALMNRSALHSVGDDGADLKLLKKYATGRYAGYTYTTFDALDGNAYVVGIYNNDFEGYLNSDWLIDKFNSGGRIFENNLLIHVSALGGIGSSSPIINISNNRVNYLWDFYDSSSRNYAFVGLMRSSSDLSGGKLNFINPQHSTFWTLEIIRGAGSPLQDYGFTDSGEPVFVYRYPTCDNPNENVYRCSSKFTNHYVLKYAETTRELTAIKGLDTPRATVAFSSLNAQPYGDGDRVYFSWRSGDEALLASATYAADCYKGECRYSLDDWREVGIPQLDGKKFKMKIISDKIYFIWPGGLGRTELDGTGWVEASYDNLGWEGVLEGIAADIEADDNGDLYLYSAWNKNIEKDHICQ